MALPASAQKWKVNPITLLDISRGAARVELDLICGHSTNAVLARCSAMPPELLPKHNAAIRGMASNYYHFRRIWEQDRAHRANPITILPKAQGVEIDALTPKVERCMTIRYIQQQMDDALYSWGKMVADRRFKGARREPYLEWVNFNAVLSVNGNKAVISLSSKGKNETVFTPSEIGVNANALQTAAAPLTPDVLLTIYNQTPDIAAEFFYLYQNFTEALEKFKASAQAADKLLATKISWETWLNDKSQQNSILRQNYEFAAANLALHTVNLLQFMAHQPQGLFAASLQVYQTIMKQNNQGKIRPSQFPEFWNQPPAL